MTSENIIHPKSKKLIDALAPEGKKLIEDITIQCLKNGISLRIYDHTSLAGNIGSFNNDDKVLMVCTGGKEADNYWIGTLIHESCHMDQWIEGSLIYKKWDCALDIQEWMNGSKWRKAEVTETIKRTINLELDCEKRSVNKIDKYKLGYVINRDMYIKRANFYIYIIKALQVFRKWPKSRKPKAWCVKMYSMMPPYFKKSYKEYPEGFLEELKKMI